MQSGSLIEQQSNFPQRVEDFRLLAMSVFQGCQTIDDMINTFNDRFPMPACYMYSVDKDKRLSPKDIVDMNKISCSGAALILFIAAQELGIVPDYKIFIITKKAKTNRIHTAVGIIDTDEISRYDLKAEPNMMSDEIVLHLGKVYNTPVPLFTNRTRKDNPTRFYDLNENHKLDYALQQSLPLLADLVNPDPEKKARVFFDAEQYIQYIEKFYKG